MCIEIEISAAGEKAFEAPQQEWSEPTIGATQYAWFAGHEMMLTRNSENPEKYELHFLGLVGSGFKGVAEAKGAAPAFAQEVFKYLSQMVDDD